MSHNPAHRDGLNFNAKTGSAFGTNQQSKPCLLAGRSFGLGANERALKTAGDQPAPDRVLLNIMMPDMDGYAVCRQLKFDFRTRQTPIVQVYVGA